MVFRVDCSLAGGLDWHGRWPCVIGFETSDGDCDKAFVYGGAFGLELGWCDLQGLGWHN